MGMYSRAEVDTMDELLTVGNGIAPDTSGPRPIPKSGRRSKYEDERLAQARISMYFKKCEEAGKPYTVTGIANYLDVSMDTLRRMEKGENGYSHGLSQLIKRAKNIVAQQVEEKILTDKNPAGAIFWSKALMGWSDQPKQESAASGGLSITLKVVNSPILSTSDGKSSEITIDAETVETPKLGKSSGSKALRDGNS